MKIIALYGGKNSKKDLLANRLANNSDVVYVKPYTDKEVPVYEEDWEMDDYIHLNAKQLSHKMEREVPLAIITLKSHRYVFFSTQFKENFCVVILDDAGLHGFKKMWDGELVTIRVHSDTEEHSDRCLMTDDEFDIVFNYDKDDYDELEHEIGWLEYEFKG